MTRTLIIAALAVASLVGTAQAGRLHRHVPATAFVATYDRHPEPVASQAAPAQEQRSDFGSFSAAATAHNLGY